FGFWTTPRSASSSGSTAPVSASSSISRTPRTGLGPATMPRSSANWRSPAGPQQPERVRIEGGLGRDAQHANPGVGDTTGGVDRIPSSQGNRDGVEREITGAQVRLDASGSQGGDVDMPAVRRGDRP